MKKKVYVCVCTYIYVYVHPYIKLLKGIKNKTHIIPGKNLNKGKVNKAKNSM